MTVEVPIGMGGDPFEPGVRAFSTDSRDIDEAQAVERVREAMRRCGDADVAFKKIDSVMRGNTFAEIGAAIECSGCELAVMSAAYPAMGRTVRVGWLHIKDCERKIDLREGLRGAGVKGVSVVHPGGGANELSQGLLRMMETGCRLAVCDAECDEDLRTLVAAARMASARVLWIGSGGLAHALAAEMPVVTAKSRAKETGGRVLMFAGSDHDVTVRQISALKRSSGAVEMAVEEATDEIAAQTVILKVTRGMTRDEQIRRVVASVVGERIGCCVMTGGDTAALVCRALGVRSLRLTEEYAPGLPQGVAVGGVLDGVTVVLKSGGFGSEDVLCGMAERFAGGGEGL
jgi:uncharacterized protein YgbK (DUF1537 family)